MTRQFWIGVAVGLTAIGWAWLGAIVVTHTLVRRYDYTIRAEAPVTMPREMKRRTPIIRRTPPTIPVETQ